MPATFGARCAVEQRHVDGVAGRLLAVGLALADQHGLVVEVRHLTLDELEVEHLAGDRGVDHAQGLRAAVDVRPAELHTGGGVNLGQLVEIGGHGEGDAAEPLGVGVDDEVAGELLVEDVAHRRLDDAASTECRRRGRRPP
jgi:hypothetical protein